MWARSKDDAATYYLTIARDTDHRGKVRCVRCGDIAADVHEIIPRSAHGPKRSKDLFDIKNRCCLCRKCHTEVHNDKGRGELFFILENRHSYEYDGVALCLLEGYKERMAQKE